MTKLNVLAVAEQTYSITIAICWALDKLVDST